MNPWQKVFINLAHHYGRQNWWQNNRLEDWLMMILVQRTNARNVALAVQNLQDVMSLDQLLALTPAELEDRVHPARFYKQKAIRIRNALEWLANAGGDFSVISQHPAAELRSQLLTLPGIGPETADVMLLYTFDKPTFVADEYARRLSARLGLGDYKTYTAMYTTMAPFAATLSLDDARELHALIDEHGKTQTRHPYDDKFLLQDTVSVDQWPAQAVLQDGPRGEPRVPK
ncbi:MAG: endonuclease III [Schleiferilactobacillus harbinensis]|jgi:endonuclease-3 related protein|nr:endonuclease III [Schleiferilactobacillus harbinensis]